MTKLSIFDKIEEAKKSTVLSQNDKIEHFWQNWRIEKSIVLSENDKIEHFWQNWKSEKNIRVSQNMTKLSIFNKTEESKNP